MSLLKSTSFFGPKKKNPMRVRPIKTEKSNARRLVNIFQNGMMKIIQFQNRIQAFWWEGLNYPFPFLFNPMVKTRGNK
jgi:hypothetical protein